MIWVDILLLCGYIYYSDVEHYERLDIFDVHTKNTQSLIYYQGFYLPS